MTADITERIGASLEKDTEELTKDLPDLLAAVEGQERELIAENPDLFAQVVSRMDDVDIATFVSEAPEAAAQFQDLLWAGVSLLVEEEEEIQDQIAADITANFEAEDCPMEGHLVVDADGKTVTGGAGLQNNPDLTLTGPADVLTSLITGSIDPIQGFMTQEYELDGSVQKGTQLAGVMDSITESVPN
jgi:putative sterol carrier protein